MRSAWKYIPVALAALTVGLAGCASGPGTGTATPTPSPTAPVCPFGDWRSTQVASTGGAAGVTVTLSGGGGATLIVASDGAAKADFTAMQPITFAVALGATQAKGEFRYSGPISGKLDFSGASASASPAQTSPGAATTTSGATPSAGASASATPGASGGTGTTGAWQPVGDVNVAELRATIKLTEPVNTTIVDNVKISDGTGGQTTQVGNAIDLQPLLRPGTYTCAGDQLTVNLSSGTTPPVTWTFAR